MRRLIVVLARLYPRWWRDRYGTEFDALIEDDRANVAAAFNVLTGAVFMHLRTVAQQRPLSGNWYLLAFSGIVQVAISAVYLASAVVTIHGWSRTIGYLGYLELTAGITASAAGLFHSRSRKSWLLVLNGSAFIGLGIIHSALMRFPIRFKTVALLVMVMAFTIGLLGRSLQARTALVAAILSSGFIAVFLALSARWITMEPGSHTDLLSLGFYFAFSAICMLAFALQAERRFPAVI